VLFRSWTNWLGVGNRRGRRYGFNIPVGLGLCELFYLLLINYLMHSTRKNRNIIFILLVCGGGAFGILLYNLLLFEGDSWIPFIKDPGNVGLFLLSFSLLTIAFSQIKALKQNSGA